MRTLISAILLFITFLFSSCFRDVVYGTGEVEKQLRPTDNIEGVAINIPVQVELTGNASSSIEIVAQKNLHNEIVTRMDGTMLVITAKSDLVSSEPIIIKLGVDNLSILELNGSGTLKSMNTINSKSIDIELTGSGNLTLDVNAEKITAMVAGSGNIKLIGKAEEFKSQINGSGDVLTSDLVCQDVYATINGSGGLYTNVNRLLKVNINGSGNVTYSGSPEIEQNINGSGKVIKN